MQSDATSSRQLHVSNEDLDEVENKLEIDKNRSMSDFGGEDGALTYFQKNTGANKDYNPQSNREFMYQEKNGTQLVVQMSG